MNLIFSVNLYEVYMAMADSKDLFSIAAVKYHIYCMEYRFFKTDFKTIQTIWVSGILVNSTQLLIIKYTYTDIIHGHVHAKRTRT